MAEQKMMSLNLDEQLKEIQDFTNRQKQDVADLMSDAFSQFDKADSLQTSEQIQQEVDERLSSIEQQLESEMQKINEQIQQLLPSSTN